MGGDGRAFEARTAASRARWWILFTVGAGTFMSALDGSAVNTVLPVIRREFGSDVATIQWVVTIYLLVVSGLLLSFGRLGDLRGHKPVYTGGFVVFIAGSAACGLSPGPSALIAARALQALGAAMLFSNSPAILTRNFPPEQRGRALGLLATMTYLGLTAGPSLGGWLTQAVGWRAVYTVNVPVGLAALLLALRFVPRDGARTGETRFDWAGAAAFTAGLVALLLALNRGHESGWGSPAILGLLAVSAALLALFVSIEARVPGPLLHLPLFRVRLFSAAAASALLNYMCLFSVVFLMPFYLIQGRGFDPARAGALLTAQPLTMAVVAPLSGLLSDRIGSRVPSTAGMLVLAAGLLLLSRLGPAAPPGRIVLSLAATGFGTGLFIAPNSSALLGAAPRERQGIASGILATARNAGMALGVGLAGAVFTTVLGARPPEGRALFTAVSAGFVAASIVAMAGAFISSVRGEST